MSDGRGAHISRRQALAATSRALAAIGIVVLGLKPAIGASKKANRDDFFYQEEPGENGKKCSGCINFSPKAAGKYGATSGDCSLVEGDVCAGCYCESWTDKFSAGAKRAGS